MSPAFACKCATVARDSVIAATPVVFDGEVLRVEVAEGGDREVTTFRVHGAVKGIPYRSPRADVARRRGERTVTVISGLDEARHADGISGAVRSV